MHLSGSASRPRAGGDWACANKAVDFQGERRGGSSGAQAAGATSSGCGAGPVKICDVWILHSGADFFHLAREHSQFFCGGRSSE